MKLSPARIAAYEVLLKIETERAYSSALLARYESQLDPVDRGLCHEIVLGLLRKKLLLDRYIDVFARGKKLDIEIRLILQIGLFQLYYLDRIPDHASVNESVELAIKAKKSSARGLINAVLRSAVRGKPGLEFKNDIERLAIETSHPEWLIEHWLEQLALGSVDHLARSNNEVPNVTFRRTVKGLSVQLPASVVESELVPGCFIASSFDPQLRDLADKGHIYFQDEASQMVAAAADIKPGDKFLDVCAAPGGKTTYVANLISNETDNLLVAGDLTKRRIRLLQDTCQKQGADFVNLVQYDAATGLPFSGSTFDRVLVDAPCTGTGTIRHNPEIRYFLCPEDFLRMGIKQAAILNNASTVVKPNGILVYSTCSLEREENEDVCKTFLSGNSEWTRIDPKVPPKFLTDQGFARTYPHRNGLDGFFIATFQRS